MDELRQEFLTEAILSLKNLQAKLRTEEISGNLEREIFRAFHTLKGTSQTFNFNVSGKLAHEIENLLQAKRDNQISANDAFTSLLKEGINLLLETFQRAQDKKEVAFPDDFAEKLRALIPNSSVAPASESLSGIVPPNLLAQLSAHEKDSLTSAIAKGNLFYLIEAGFEFANFAEKFKDLRQILSESGEVIATFPSPKFALENKIGFQIFFVSSKDKNDIVKAVQPFGANLLFQNSENNFVNDLKGILAQAVLTGEKTAQILDKKIEFEIVADDIELSGKRLKLVSEILLHLVRNAVDHGIETRGKIKIELSNQKDALLLRVADDGRGIDVEKIRAKAIAKNLISADEDLTKETLLKLVFAHGFSTSETVSDISGRGVGLDVVGDAVEKANGEIRLESETGKGTVFEIRLPTEN
jgi:two-component system chemotaxis sensor kinase CheA